MPSSEMSVDSYPCSVFSFTNASSGDILSGQHGIVIWHINVSKLTKSQEVLWKNIF